MFSKTILLATLFALPALSAYVDVKRQANSYTNSTQAASLPSCGPDSGPCNCPEGTFYETSTSYAFYPATVKDVAAVAGGFFDTAWFGIALNKSQGTDDQPGAKRWAFESVPMGVSELLVSEELVNYTTYPSGGFYYQYEGVDLPLRYQKTDGTTGEVGGSWEFIDVKEITEGWTSFVWNIHACLTDVWALAEFHEGAMTNVSSILKSKGQLNGDIEGPFSF